MVNSKAQKIVIIALVVFGVFLTALALWPDWWGEPQPTATTLVRTVKAEALSPWQQNWPDLHLAEQFSRLPLFGALLDFYTMEAVDEGMVAVALFTLPDNPSPAKVWYGCLIDAEILADRVFALLRDVQGIYVVAGMEFCQDGCGDHFYDMWGIYITREAVLRDGPRGWRLLSGDIWWDESYFDAGEGR